MRICECREPAEITPCKVLAERRWFSEKTEKLGLGREREHMDSRARGAARVASGGSMTWRERVGSDGVDPSWKPPEMLTHPPHLVGVHKLFFPAVCEVELELELELVFIAFGVLGFVFTFWIFGHGAVKMVQEERDVGSLNNVAETLNGHFYLYGKCSKDQGSSDSQS
jgi:hypothetical protein